ncbi:tetratricopeptide repeat protein [Reticulibacter mediterranei]|uniref:tetratricopeptide repeat protein n=1 Tax=Reticulibacter mediterranei TaxID=2778369 RepID=UPI001C68B62E|nr:tetratricopeptide repeat protein [Reticulibacter mediterranei]
MADALLADLSGLSEHLQEERKYLLMFFDTYELIEQNPVIAVLRFSQSFPDDYRFEQIGAVVAGRNQLDWLQPNWRDRESEVLEVALAPFNEAEMQQYFEQLSTVDQDALNASMQLLYARTEGRPILVGLVNDVLNRRVISIKALASISLVQFEASLVAKINDFERPFDTILLYMAHTYHRFNFELLHWLFESTGMQDILFGNDDTILKQQLLELSFVRRASTASDDFVLHDEMRPLINKYCWEKLDPDKRSRKEISKYVISYYEKKLTSGVLSEELRQAYTVELLYHKLFFDIDSGYGFFERNFSKAILLWLSAFARSLLLETNKFLSALSTEQQYMLKRYEAQLLQKEERGEEALVLYEQLEREADPKWIEKQYTDIVYEKGTCYYQLSQYLEATAAFSEARDLARIQNNDSDYASMLNWLGATYQRQGQLDTALQYFDESIAVHKRLGNRNVYTSILTSSGSVYRLQGKIDEALRRTKVAWRIRVDQFKQGKISEIFVGWSLNAIGNIYTEIDDLVEAEKCFQEAFDIFARLGSKKGQATMYNRFGELSDARGNLDESLEWYRKAYISALGGIDIESQINSLNKQGHIFMRRQQLHEAEEVLTRAVKLAQQVHDPYQQAESLIDLVKIYKQQGEQEKADQALQEAEGICYQYNYNYLLGVARKGLGDFYIEKGAYQEAFHYYGEACRFMALYNSIKYNKFLRNLNDTLIQIPSTQIAEITQMLIKYWQAQGLEQNFPEFIVLCEEVQSMMGI